MTLSVAQVGQLLQPINKKRVLADGKGHAHVSQQDILAHLIRVFGFTNFDIHVITVECVFESPNAKNAARFDVCYRALIRLTIRDAAGKTLAEYENGSTATAQNQTRGDAHDLAYKSAISLSVKRAAIALGDQFGLSLYNKGQTNALVMATLVKPAEDGEKQPAEDVQQNVPQQVSLGNDETDVPLESEERITRTADPGPDPWSTRPQTAAAPDGGASGAGEAPAARAGAVAPQAVDGLPPVEVVEDAEPRLGSTQRVSLISHFKRLGVQEREERIYTMSVLARRKILTANDLSVSEASAMLHLLGALRDAEMLQAKVIEVDNESSSSAGDS